MKYLVASMFGILFSFYLLGQGPYAPRVGVSGNNAVSADSNIIVEWATGAILNRGYMNIANPSAGLANVGSESNALGKASENGVVSLGDGGIITLTFAHPIKNIPGPDFAVFENGFDDFFLELAFVEVSSDGVQFFRFKANSLTDTSIQVSSYDSLEATNLHNLAGKYRGGYGVPFDLEELKGINGLDISEITHVRVVDVVGSVNNNYATRDSKGNKVNDPWPTEFPSGGFDFDAVGVIGSTSTGLLQQSNIALNIYPNPVSELFTITLGNPSNGIYNIYNSNGQLLVEGQISQSQRELSFSVSELKLQPGIHFILVKTEDFNSRMRVVVL